MTTASRPFIAHVAELAASSVKYCSACRHFRHHPSDPTGGGTSGLCLLFNRVNLVSADKQLVSAQLARCDEDLCGKGARHFEDRIDVDPTCNM